MSFFPKMGRFGLATLLLFGTTLSWASDRYDPLEVCELATAGGQLSTEARCGILTVPEDPNDSHGEGRMLDLAYAVLPARNGRGLADPVFFLAGGPGQSAREMAPILQRTLRDIHRNRDLIFLDQRGTGASNPLNCELEESTETWIEPDPDLTIEKLLACRDQWEADVRFYTTWNAAHDLDLLRRHLGFDQINLIGGSYGTRLAQVYLKYFGEHVRTALLDGVIPMRLALGSEHGPALDLTLLALIETCEADAACQAAFPNLANAFDELKRQYDSWTDGPLIQLTHPRLGEAFELRFTRGVLATALRFLAYDPNSQMLLPYLIHEAATTGQPDRLAAQALIVSEQMNEVIAIGLNFAVGCAEDWGRWPDTATTASTLLGDSIGDLYRGICPQWPEASVPADFNEPYLGDTPMLLFSGQWDPVTPPSYGDEVDALSQDARHLVATGRGHIVMMLPCMARIASNFIDAASSADLDVTCIDALGPEPFFTDLLGPAP